MLPIGRSDKSQVIDFVMKEAGTKLSADEELKKFKTEILKEKSFGQDVLKKYKRDINKIKTWDDAIDVCGWMGWAKSDIKNFCRTHNIRHPVL